MILRTIKLRKSYKRCSAYSLEFSPFQRVGHGKTQTCITARVNAENAKGVLTLLNSERAGVLPLVFFEVVKL